MIPKSTKDLLKEFRSVRGQTEEPPIKKEPPRKRKNRSKTHYDVFLKKYEDLENRIDDFNTQDLVFYFREIAKEHGYKYVISSMPKEMAIMKRVEKDFDNKEICAMIEFLFESDQDYLDKNGLTPSILGSRWVNTIYADTKKWINDEYVPNSVKERKKSNVKQREWDKKIADTDDDVKIGVKL